MAVLKFSPEADGYLTDLEQNPRTQRCAAKVNSALDVLEDDPGAVESRRRKFLSVDMWGIPLFCDDEELLILWGWHPVEEDVVIVHYIGPSP